MADYLLWKVLTQTDHNAMNARAKQSMSGGGAMHIALGVDRDEFPIKKFLNARQAHKTIITEPWPGHFGEGELIFDGNPSRRGGEWRITDQAHHRHPAWVNEQGFPENYNLSNRPIVFICRLGGAFHPRFKLEHSLSQEPDGLGTIVQSTLKGIRRLRLNWAEELGLTENQTNISLLESAEEESLEEEENDYVPNSLNDARKRVVQEIVRRQGQQRFRKQLLANYNGKCAISGCNVESVLQAAHISPYRGPDTNHASNGILLRADLHTLFDLGLITVTPDRHQVLVSGELRDSIYYRFHHKPIKEPKNKISNAALEEHMNFFIE